MLTPAFARGWRKLPNELKLEVLAYLIPHKAILAASILSETSRRSWHNPAITQDDKCSISHLWLLLEHPDFAALSRDVFFANNTISMQADGPSYDMPAPKMAPLLQHLRVTLVPTYSEWRWLARFAAIMGIGRLQSLELVFELQCWYYGLPKFYDEVDFACPIGLDVKSLSIRYEYCQQPVTAWYPEWDPYWGADPFKEELDRFKDIYVSLLQPV
ncbi:hypothetical protein FB567DRAFT_106814 [Paraphoma chrysanthemicola]|uniref:F-box domain-containing protein n=1 Tax=Paraphoma chrysanthemicola TaxID=798071 RepID=A0A8K0R1A8_9PLEO|nr:hypothetical protein FB567DRAFT_106814 [Paraphoma chrysanthemicola]